MRKLDSLVASLLLCTGGVPTGTSFSSYPSSGWPTTSPAFPNTADHVTWLRWRHHRHPQKRRCRGSGDGSSSRLRQNAAAVTIQEELQYTKEDLVELSRSELQAICRKLKLRAVGRTEELRSRVVESNRKYQQSLATATDSSAAFPPPAGDGDIVESHRGDTITTASSCTSSSGGGGGGGGDGGVAEAVVEAAASAPQIDFLMEDVRPAFAELSDEQWAKAGQLGRLLTEWNGKMNLISRKDIANVMKRHVIPCLAMAKALNLEDGIDVLDVGTGGGLPGLPLAICYPNVKFTLIDGTGKKIAAVADMAERMGLSNVRTFHIRAEEVYEVFDYVMGRAVSSLPKFVGFIVKNLKPNVDTRQETIRSDAQAGGGGSDSANTTPLKRGVLYMRGEVSEEELAKLGARPSVVIPLQRVMEEAGLDGDVGLGGEVDDRGYSSVFHFTSEAIWNRVPVSSGDAGDV